MILDALRRVVSRLVPSSTALNTLNLPPAIPIHFQKSPDFPDSGARGIEGMDFQVRTGGAVVQTGRTGRDGKVDVRVPPGGSSTVGLLFNGAVVAQYVVTVDAGALAELESLPPAARAPADAWIRKVRGRSGAIEAARLLAADALAGLTK